MTVTAIHTMDVEQFTDQQLVRFSCRTCDRCVESGPDGLRVLNKGDFLARHMGGELSLSSEVEADGAAPRGPVLH